MSKASHLPAWGLPPRLRLSGVRHLYIVSDRGGVWATLRSRPMPRAVRGLRIRYVGAYEDDGEAWEHFRAA